MTDAVDIADQFLESLIELDPILGTGLGVAETAGKLPDFSPRGVDAVGRLEQRTLASLAAVATPTDAARRTRDVLSEVLQSDLDQHALGEPLRSLRNFGSPPERVRGAFDLMPRSSAADWEAVITRMDAVPTALAGATETLREGMRRGVVAARRQAAVVAMQCRVWSGAASGPGYFSRLLEDGTLAEASRAAATGAAQRAEAAMGHLADFLETEYAPVARPADPVGRETYAVWARHFNGIDLDLDDTYGWGWEELHRLDAEIADTAQRIAPGGGLHEASELLNSDSARAIHGVASFRQWLQELTDRAIRELNGRHFDMSPEAQRVECMIAPPGGAAAMYYTPPTEDWSRPGRTWYPAGDRTVFPTWEEVTTAYHEGVPGHHLQVVAVRLSPEQLSRFQRNHFTSGHGEGWALYAERLMDELGYHDSPDTRLGMLVASAFRAARVILDIGLHLELAIPVHSSFCPGERWDPENAARFLSRYAGRGGGFVSSEIDRYLGMPGQAISYKVGEREWLDIRREVSRRDGDNFDLKAFHTRALAIGPMGLAQLRREMTQAPS